MELSADIIWLVIGCIALFLEMAAVPAVGFFFVALGAFTLGGLIAFEVIFPDSWLTQIAYFLGLTVAWAVALWKPFQHFIKKNGDSDYQDMIGSTAIVEEKGLKGMTPGKVRWSGALMNARITKSSAIQSIKAGEYVIIKKVEGTTLFVDVE